MVLPTSVDIPVIKYVLIIIVAFRFALQGAFKENTFSFQPMLNLTV